MCGEEQLNLNEKALEAAAEAINKDEDCYSKVQPWERRWARIAVEAYLRQCAPSTGKGGVKSQRQQISEMREAVDKYMYDEGWNAAIEHVSRVLRLRADHQVSEDLQILAAHISTMARP